MRPVERAKFVKICNDIETELGKLHSVLESSLRNTDPAVTTIKVAVLTLCQHTRSLAMLLPTVISDPDEPDLWL